MIYKELTTNNGKFDEVANGNEGDVDLIMKDIDNELKSIKYKAFGKVKIKPFVTTKEPLTELMKKKEKLLSKEESNMEDVDKIDEEICEQLKKKNKESIENELRRIEKVKQTKGNSAAVFDLKSAILGKKNQGDEPACIIDPKSNKPVFHPSGILSVCEKYIKELLTNRSLLHEFTKGLTD